MSVKGTVRVILKYPKYKSDSKQYPLNKNMEDIDFFIGLKMFNYENTIRFPGLKMRKSFL